MRNIRLAVVGAVFFLVPAVGAIAYESYCQQKFLDENRNDPALNQIVFYSSPVDRVPNKTIAFRFYGLRAEMMADATVRVNNHGFISQRDYRYEKNPREFRIVILGGEQTASSVVSVSWPDHLQDELKKRMPNKEITVYNLGWPDAGPDWSLETWTKEGLKYNPDLVVMNIIENDFIRAAQTHPDMPARSAPLARIGGKAITYSPIEYRLSDSPDDVVRFSPVPHSEGTTIVSLRSPAAVPSRPYGVFATSTFIRDTRLVAEVQKKIVDDMIAGVKPCFGCFLWASLRGAPVFSSVSSLRNLDEVPSDPVNVALYEKLGIERFVQIVRTIPGLVLTHNFHYGEVSGVEFGFTRALERADPNSRVIDMRKRIPAGTSDEELRSWYMYPFMAEKWNEKGHHVYASMMADIVEEWMNARPMRRRATSEIMIR